MAMSKVYSCVSIVLSAIWFLLFKLLANLFSLDSDTTPTRLFLLINILMAIWIESAYTVVMLHEIFSCCFLSKLDLRLIGQQPGQSAASCSFLFQCVCRQAGVDVRAGSQRFSEKEKQTVSHVLFSFVLLRHSTFSLDKFTLPWHFSGVQALCSETLL